MSAIAAQNKENSQLSRAEQLRIWKAKRDAQKGRRGALPGKGKNPRRDRNQTSDKRVLGVRNAAKPVKQLHCQLKPTIAVVQQKTSVSKTGTSQVLRSTRHKKENLKSPPKKTKQAHSSPQPPKSPHLEMLRQRLKSSAKKNRQSLHSGVSAQTLRLQQRLSARKRKRTHTRAGAEVPKQKTMRLNSTSAARSSSRASRKSAKSSQTRVHRRRPNDSERAAMQIERDIPARRERERRARLEILVQGDLDLADAHVAAGRIAAAKKVMLAMSPETMDVAGKLSGYWMRRLRIECALSTNSTIIRSLCLEALKSTTGQDRGELEEFARCHGVSIGSDGKAPQSIASSRDQTSAAAAGEADGMSRRLNFSEILIDPPCADQQNTPAGSEDGDTNSEPAEDKDGDLSMNCVFDEEEEELDMDVAGLADADMVTAAEFAAHAAKRRSVSTRKVSPARRLSRTPEPARSPENVEGASVVLMSKRRVTGHMAEEVGADVALTPVRRSTRNLVPGSESQNTVEMLREVGFAFVPNDALRGSNFAPDYQSSSEEDSVCDDDDASEDDAAKAAEDESMSPLPARAVDSPTCGATPGPIREELEDMLGF